MIRNRFPDLGFRSGFFSLPDPDILFSVSPHWKCTIVRRTSPFFLIAVAQRRVPQGAGPRFETGSHIAAGRNHLMEKIAPLLPTGIGERYCQTISNLGHAALLRRCELHLFRKYWTSSGGPLVDSLLWGANQLATPHACKESYLRRSPGQLFPSWNDCLQPLILQLFQRRPFWRLTRDTLKTKDCGS